ncbi:hypothetical protein PR202_ga31124 [Eleusine coracana subsp. coracana]|uniref:Uncharacterized protein n=1 Tax=Eleusine coracana subsp. coracana TaxID=191504 RepID=A0AAV5DRI1_ELECO|nr:hypothetical protein PR202_ga31124 [Eleusine coracana subsp. coracana]
MVLVHKDENPSSAATPKGKYWGIVICWLMGNGCLFGFNSMLTTLDYYMYLFPKYHPARVIFLTYQPFVLTTTAIFTYYEAKVNTRRRILVGYTLFFLSSLAVILLDVATSGRGGVAPFVGTCIISASFGVANGHVQGGMSGDLALMCPEFLQSFYAGIAASGALTSTLRFITKAAFENSQDGLRKGAVLFSAISCFFGMICAVLYAFVFPKLSIVNLYRSQAAFDGSLTVTADLAAAGIQTQSNLVGWMILLTSFLGLSHGYLAVCVITEAPKGYKGPEQNAFGNLLAFSLLGGIFFGAVLDWLWLIGKGWNGQKQATSVAEHKNPAIRMREAELTNVRWLGFLGSYKFIDEEALRQAMLAYGVVTKTKVFLSRQCAFVEFGSAAGVYDAKKESGWSSFQ